MLRAATTRIPRQRRNLCQIASDSVFLPFLYPLDLLDWQSSRYFSSSLCTKRPARAAVLQLDRSYITAPTVARPDLFLEADLRLLGYSKPHHEAVSSSLAPLDPTKQRTGTADLSRVVIFDAPVGERHSARRTTNEAISNDIHEVLATFNACISVGRVARAKLMLQHVTDSLDKDSPILVGAHNAFLQALLNRALAEGSDRDENLRVFYMWYEEKMKHEFKVAGDATTFALLLKGSLAMTNHLHGTRYVKEYVTFWKDSERDIGEVLNLHILTDEEVISVAKLCYLKVSELHEKHRVLFEDEAPISPPQIASIPEVKPTVVKGPGLAAIKQSLRSLVDPDAIPTPHSFGKDDIVFQIERQKLLEEDAFDSAQERWRKDHEALASKGVLSMSEGINHLFWRWHQALVLLIQEELVRVKQAEEYPTRSPVIAERCIYGPFLRLLSPEKIAAIVVLEMVRAQNSTGNGEGVKSSMAVMTIGKALEAEYMAQELSKKKTRDLLGKIEKDQLIKIFENRAQFKRRVREARAKLAEHPQATVDILPDWPHSVMAKLGAVLISMLLHCGKIPVKRKRPDTGEEITREFPAFYHSYEYVKGRKLGVLKRHSEVTKSLGSEPLRRGVVGRQLPMVVPPRPWMAWNDGGYYYARSQVVRTKSSKEQEIYVRAASARGDLDQLFQGLDVLGQTAWKINKRVFEVVLRAWNSGEKFADIPASKLDIDLPPAPAPSADPGHRVDWLNKAREMKKQEINNHSQRAGINFKVEIARAFLFERFYFPHSIDFRGRAYPIPPNLNHIGDDLSRGLLMFDEAKEVGESGLRWLKIHLSNLAGYDKASFVDRAKFCDEHLENIFDSADKPLEGSRWWLDSEDPWQCLAACFALREAYSLADPTTYKCHIPVAQDGTCNGLQHYAALGGDIMGAKQVNLEPSDKPQDVYTGVAELVKAAVKRDMEEGEPLAKQVYGFINRKVVKQTVMTNVYGVTFVGARAQIEGQLRDIGLLDRETLVKTSTYLTKKVFKSIKSMFFGATKIQNWLAMSARRISRSIAPAQFKQLRATDGKKLKTEFMTSVVWTTPLGVPIVQPYRQNKLHVVQTNLQKVYIQDPTVIDQVNARKQMTAFPPNFIHSLDATHMLLSAIKSAEHGLTFASVHDSFWTHPSDVDTLNRILRDAFVSLHTENLIERLLSEFLTRYAGYKYFASINLDTSAAQEIVKARRQYAQEVLGKSALTVMEDLQWELERDRLLASENEQERKQGEGMVTPSVILARAGGLEKMEVEEPLELELGESKKQFHTIDMTVETDSESELDAVTGDSTEENIEEMSVSDKEEEYCEVEIDGGHVPLEEAAAEEPHKEEESVKLDDGEIVSSSPVMLNKIKKPASRRMPVWMPLEFPPLPEKGEFQVARLKDSQYFFS